MNKEDSLHEEEADRRKTKQEKSFVCVCKREIERERRKPFKMKSFLLIAADRVVIE